MSLPGKKIYIDTQYKTASSPNSSQFTIELPYTITLPHNAIFTTDEICIPRAWYTVEKDVNDKLYIHVLNTSDRTRFNVIATVAPAVYTGTTFRSALQSALDAQIPVSTASFVVTYDGVARTTVIAENSPIYQFYVLSDVEVANGLRGLWNSVDSNLTYGGIIDVSNIASINDILRNLDAETKLYGSDSFVSGFLNFQGLNNLYLSSPNLGTFTTMGTRGESTIIKKIPVSADYGFMIIDRSASIHDYLECGKCTLKTIDFELSDSKGRYVPLHGANITFSIVFANKSED